MITEISLEDRLDSYFVGKKLEYPDGITRRAGQVHTDMDHVATDVVRFFVTLQSDTKTIAFKENTQYLTIGITKSLPKGSGIISFTADFEGENFTKFILYRCIGRETNTYMWDENNVSKCIGGVLTRKYVQGIMLDIFGRI
jgi:hypothetical protein